MTGTSWKYNHETLAKIVWGPRFGVFARIGHPKGWTPNGGTIEVRPAMTGLAYLPQSDGSDNF